MRRRLGLLLILLVSMASSRADCWQQTAQRFAVSARLLQAIAQVESGGRSEVWHRNHDGSIDRGLMQVNSRWWPRLMRAGIQPNDLFDACVCIHVGAWILAQAIAHTGARWAAVGVYHGGSQDERRRYIARVYRAWRHGSPQVLSSSE